MLRRCLVLVSVALATRGQTDMRGLVVAGRCFRPTAGPRVEGRASPGRTAHRSVAGRSTRCHQPHGATEQMVGPWSSITAGTSTSRRARGRSDVGDGGFFVRSLNLLLRAPGPPAGAPSCRPRRLSTHVAGSVVPCGLATRSRHTWCQLSPISIASANPVSVLTPRRHSSRRTRGNSAVGHGKAAATRRDHRGGDPVGRTRSRPRPAASTRGLSWRPRAGQTPARPATLSSPGRSLHTV